MPKFEIGNVVTYRKDVFPEKHGVRLVMQRELWDGRIEVTSEERSVLWVHPNQMELHPERKRNEKRAAVQPTYQAEDLPMPVLSFDSTPVALPDYSPSSDSSPSYSDDSSSSFDAGGGSFDGGGSSGDW